MVSGPFFPCGHSCLVGSYLDQASEFYTLLLHFVQVLCCMDHGRQEYFCRRLDIFFSHVVLKCHLLHNFFIHNSTYIHVNNWAIFLKCWGKMCLWDFLLQIEQVEQVSTGTSQIKNIIPWDMSPRSLVTGAQRLGGKEPPCK